MLFYKKYYIKYIILLKEFYDISNLLYRSNPFLIGDRHDKIGIFIVIESKVVKRDLEVLYSNLN